MISLPDRLTSKLFKVGHIFAMLLSLFALLHVGGILYRLRIYILDVPYEAVCLTLFLSLYFLFKPVRKGQKKTTLPWYDIVFILASLCSAGYMIFFWEVALDSLETGTTSTFLIVLGLILMVTILEAVRRAYGWFIPIFVMFIFGHTFFTNYFPGFLHGRGYSFDRVVPDLYVETLGIWGMALHVGTRVIFMFIIFGAFLRVTGAGDFLTRVAFALAGWMKGGPAKASIVASAFFGTLSGSAVANVASTGAVTIPIMKKNGYRPEFAGAVEAVASTGGQLVPPVMGAVIFIMCEYLDIPYIQVCFAAILPAILYYAALFLAVHFEAARTGIKSIPRSELPRLKQELKKGWMFIAPLAVLVYLLIVLRWTPESACFFSIVTLIISSAFRGKSRPTLKQVLNGLKAGTMGMLEIGNVCACIGIIMGCIALTGLGVKLSTGLIGLAGGNLMLLLLFTAMASFLMGMGLPSVLSYIVLAALVAPAIIKLGVLPIAAHLMVFYFGMATFITPPVCLAAFTGAAIAGSAPMRTGWIATRLGITCLIIPFVFALDPSLLMKGPLEKIAWSTLRCLIGVTSLAAGLSGYLLKNASIVERGCFVIGAILMLAPETWTTLAGLTLVAMATARQVILSRRARMLRGTNNLVY